MFYLQHLCDLSNSWTRMTINRVLTLDFFWAERKVKFHFSKFRKSVIWKRKDWSSQCQLFQTNKQKNTWNQPNIVWDGRAYSSIWLHMIKLRQIQHTFKCFIKLIFAEDDAQIVDSTGVKLHSEDDITGRATEALVVTLELWTTWESTRHITATEEHTQTGNGKRITHYY